MLTTYQIAKQVAAGDRSSCGLDRNIHGVYTLGFYTAPDPARKYGRYYQLQRKTKEEIRAVAKRLGFKCVLDRITK